MTDEIEQPREVVAEAVDVSDPDEDAMDETGHSRRPIVMIGGSALIVAVLLTLLVVVTMSTRRRQ